MSSDERRIAPRKVFSIPIKFARSGKLNRCRSQRIRRS